MRVWRIATVGHVDFDGEGARRYGSRWTSRGLPVVYTSATLSLAALERFVHTDPDLEPDNLLAIPVDLPGDMAIESVSPAELPEHWREYPAPESLQQWGNQWLQNRQTAVLSLPSAVIPQERNFLVNPRHPDLPRIEIGEAEPFSFDTRMWKAVRIASRPPSDGP